MKSRLDELAIFGGSPAFEEPVHTGRPNIGDRQRLQVGGQPRQAHSIESTEQLDPLQQPGVLDIKS